MSSPWLRIIGFGIVEWLEKRPFSAEKRAMRKARRKAKRKLRRGETLTPDELILVSAKEGRPMLEGKKTYLGIATIAIGLVLGWFGIGQCDPAVVAECVSSETITSNIVAAIDKVIVVFGMLLAAYGRAKAKV